MPPGSEVVVTAGHVVTPTVSVAKTALVEASTSWNWSPSATQTPVCAEPDEPPVAKSWFVTGSLTWTDECPGAFQ